MKAILLIALISTPLNAQTLEFYETNTKFVIQNTWAAIEPALSEKDQASLEVVETYVVKNWHVSALAYLNRIEIDLGMVWVLDQLSFAIAAETVGFSGCLEEYGEYLFEGLGSNSENLSDRMEVSPIATLMTYGNEFSGNCTGFDWNSLDERDRELRASSVGTSIMFIYLHELAHHALGHTSEHPSTLLDSRGAEAEADRWAIETGIAASFDMSLAIPVYVFTAYNGSISLEDEVKSTHPSGPRRLLKNYEIIIRNFRLKQEDKYADHLERNLVPLIIDALPK